MDDMDESIKDDTEEEDEDGDLGSNDIEEMLGLSQTQLAKDAAKKVETKKDPEAKRGRSQQKSPVKVEKKKEVKQKEQTPS